MGAGTAGVINSSTITTLTNSGTVSGGAGGLYGGGVGVRNLRGAGIGSLNDATGAKIMGGNGRSSFTDGAGGAGIMNSGTIATLTNKGTISGGTGGAECRIPV